MKHYFTELKVSILSMIKFTSTLLTKKKFISLFVGHSPFVRYDRPKRTGSGQFKWKGPRRT